jgi:hypothetical protein
MATYIGKDENGDPMYDGTLPRPVIKFTGTVKLHGTNASVAYNSQAGLWYQSRKNVITVQKDNAGFAFFADSNRAKFEEFMETLIKDNEIDTDNYTVTIYGEWCGGNIQKNVAITQLDKMFVIFGVKVSPIDTNSEESSYWIDHTGLKDVDNRIFNINDFPTYEVSVDFNDPKPAQEKITEMVLEVEKECPVGKTLGVSGIGEGIVFTSKYKDANLRFKAKGKEHSTSKGKKKQLIEIDPEKMENIQEFIEYSVTENRLNQAIEQVFTVTSTTPTIKMMGQFLKWMVNDILKEEMDVMKESNLEPKDVQKHISNNARKWFMDYLDKQAGIA